jgi:hypothetical protein
MIQPPQKLAGLKVDVFVAPFELIELLEDRDRDRDVVPAEVADAARVVKDDVGVENEDFGGSGRLSRHHGLREQTRE